VLCTQKLAVAPGTDIIRRDYGDPVYSEKSKDSRYVATLYINGGVCAPSLQTRSASSWLQQFVFGEEAPPHPSEQSPKSSLQAVHLITYMHFPSFGAVKDTNMAVRVGKGLLHAVSEMKRQRTSGVSTSVRSCSAVSSHTLF